MTKKDIADGVYEGLTRWAREWVDDGGGSAYKDYKAEQSFAVLKSLELIMKSLELITERLKR
jgi:hypothetical protein